MVKLLCAISILAVIGCSLALPAKKTDTFSWEKSGYYQGDILLTPEQMESRVGTIDPAFRWPNNHVAYALHPGTFSDEQAALIRESLDAIEVETCVRFVERTTEVNFVNVTGIVDAGCFSWVGMVNWGAQQLNLQTNGCVHKHIIVHEFLHAIGFWHMQSAYDRDDFVTINWENIIPGMEHNFDKFDRDEVTHFGVPYDIYSIMHYGEYYFSSNGLPTITAHDPDATLGNADRMTEKDIARINLMYNC